MAIRVLILGGGVAGMSAAHELVERGFSVTILERQKHLPGGKAKSTPIEGPVSDGRSSLPGEHGFRFFPGFYRHITDTMKRIPFYNATTGKYNRKGVYDNLVSCSRLMLARMQQPSIVVPSRFPKSWKDIALIVHTFKHTDSGLKPGEKKVILKKIIQLATSSRKRREEEYEYIGWWKYTEADKYSTSYRTLFVDGLTRALIAAKAETANLRTNGNILLQNLYGFINPFIKPDRVLCGPSNEMWLSPWLHYLKSCGVEYHFDCEVLSIMCDDQQVIAIDTLYQGCKKRFEADYYLCSTPVERTAKFIDNPHLFKLDPRLKNIIELSKSVAWMNGVQYYLKDDVFLNEGHILLIDTPWALTAISQAQFWPAIDLTNYGTGDVKGIISVDVSNWERQGVIFNKSASECTKKEVIIEIWEQMKLCFNTGGKDVLVDSNLKLAHIDDSILFEEELHALNSAAIDSKLNQLAQFGSNKVTTNEEPLLINEVGSWNLRTEARTAIPNFFLASDYVRTFTNLATMEGANEAARRAVNGIIEASGQRATYCKIWNLRESVLLSFFRYRDRRRFKLGLPW